MKNLKNLPYLALAMFMTSDLMAQCDPSKQACVGAPEGILSGNEKITGAATFLNWLLFSASMVGAIVFGIRAAKKLSDEQWFSALGPGVGSMVCGLVTYISFTVIN
jgi:hypothetical protein